MQNDAVNSLQIYVTIGCTLWLSVSVQTPWRSQVHELRICYRNWNGTLNHVLLQNHFIWTVSEWYCWSWCSLQTLWWIGGALSKWIFKIFVSCVVSLYKSICCKKTTRAPNFGDMCLCMWYIIVPNMSCVGAVSWHSCAVLVAHWRPVNFQHLWYRPNKSKFYYFIIIQSSSVY